MDFERIDVSLRVYYIDPELVTKELGVNATALRRRDSAPTVTRFGDTMVLSEELAKF